MAHTGRLRAHSVHKPGIECKQACLLDINIEELEMNSSND